MYIENVSSLLPHIGAHVVQVTAKLFQPYPTESCEMKSLQCKFVTLETLLICPEYYQHMHNTVMAEGSAFTESL